MGSVRQSEERNRRGIDKRGKGKDLYDDTQEDGRVERQKGKGGKDTREEQQGSRESERSSSTSTPIPSNSEAREPGGILPSKCLDIR